MVDILAVHDLDLTTNAKGSCIGSVMTKVIATSVHLITISVASKGCRCSMQFRNRSTQFKMPDYTCYDGKYVAFCFFAVNAFYLTAMAILFLYNRNTNMNQRYETPPQQESNVYVVAPPKGEGEYSITIKEAFKQWLHISVLKVITCRRKKINTFAVQRSDAWFYFCTYRDIYHTNL